MVRRRTRPEDLSKLVRDTSESNPDLTSPASGPRIEISHPNVPAQAPEPEGDDGAAGGVTNPVFHLGEEEEEEEEVNENGVGSGGDADIAPPEGTTVKQEAAVPVGAPPGGNGDKDVPPAGGTGRGAPHGKAPDAGAGDASTELPPVETVEKGGEGEDGADGKAELHTSASSPGGMSRKGGHTLRKSHSLTVPDGLRWRHSLSAPDNDLMAPSPSESSDLSLASSNMLNPLNDRGHRDSVTWSEIDRLESRRASTDRDSITSEEEMGRRMSTLSSAMGDRLRDLSRRFSMRTERYKEQTVQPPTPSTGDSTASGMSRTSAMEEEAREEEAMKAKKAAEIAAQQAERDAANALEEIPVRYWQNKCCKVRVPGCWESLIDFTTVIDPQSRNYLVWLAFVTFVYLYNCMASTLRAGFRAGPFYVFPEQMAAHREKYLDIARNNCLTIGYTQNGTNFTTSDCYFNTTDEEALIPPYPVRWRPGYETPENRIYWWMVDYFCDFIYIVDIIFVRSRISFINNGLFELDLISIVPVDLFYVFPVLDFNAGVRINRSFRLTNFRSIFDNFDRNYILCHFWSITQYDLISLTPMDLLYFIPQLDYFSLVRIPRMMRIHIFWEFMDRVDQAARSGYIIRIIRTLTYMLFLIHLESCGYYAMSSWEGFGLNDWVYSGEGNAYIRCAYLATKTATSIGNNPKPRNTLEYGFMTVYWLSGVFVFAMLIGQIRDIFQSVTGAEAHYRRSMDRAVSYMQGLNVPTEMQNKVRSWFNYNWQHQKTLNENSLLQGLPPKMVAELLISVHFHTLSKVQLFQDCEKNLLYDLVVKLQPSLYLPTDYICKKGEVGTEMYILKQGHVEVVGGENDSIVFATLHEGSVFGEISLLGIQGGNRRTASVRSKGYSNLFVLTKVDFEMAMADYPEAHRLLKRRSKKVLAKNVKKREEKKIEAEEIIKHSEQETPKMVKTVISTEGIWQGTSDQCRRHYADVPCQMPEVYRRILVDKLVEATTKLRRNSMRRASCLSDRETPTGSIRGDLDLLSNADDDDEILRIEHSERPLSANEHTTLDMERSTFTPEPAVIITMEDLQKEQSVPPPGEEQTSFSANTPPPDDTTTEKTVTTSPITQPNGHINKVHPAEISIEKEIPVKAKKKKGIKLMRSNRIDPANGDLPGKGTDSKGAKPTKVFLEEKNSANTVGKIPHGNIITCDVEVHREKTPSLTSVRAGAGGQNTQGPGTETEGKGAESPTE